MKLIRLATIYFEPIPQDWKHWELTLDGVNVSKIRTRELDQQKLQVFVMAQVNLNEKPPVTDGIIQIPEEPRKQAEKAIETLANYISVSEMSKRTILSPNPCIAFLPEDSNTRAWLDTTKGFSIKSHPMPSFRSSMSKEMLENDFSDRLDGVALLSEEFSHKHVTGKLHELIRLFERAFGESSSPLINPLSEFLASKEYSKQEIDDWIRKFRHPATHATKGKFLLESDVRPVIRRMEQAAYDVLFNKLKWNDKSIERRDVLSRPYAIKEQDRLYIKKSENRPELIIELLDPFGVYPIDEDFALGEFPNEWWVKMIETDDATMTHVEDIKMDLEE